MLLSSSRRLSLFNGVMALLGWGVLLALAPFNILLTVPFLASGVILLLIGLLKRTVRKRRYIAPLGLAFHSLVVLATLGVLFLAEADILIRLMLVILLLVASLSTLRAFYIWGPRRTSGLERYYDR